MIGMQTNLISMRLEHIAIWTDDLEQLKDFYIKYFDGKPNKKYSNIQKQFHSYFISFGSGARLEIMTMPNIPANTNDTVSKQYKGIIHLAYEVRTKQEVDNKLQQFQSDGIRILNLPRITGDGYYEFVILDPDNNRIEIFSNCITPISPARLK